MNLELWFRNIFYWIFSGRFFENKVALDAAMRFALEYPYPQSAVAFEKQVEAANLFNCKDSLAYIKQKTLIICGKEDLLFPPEDSINVLQAIPETGVAIIEDAAHSIHMENPGAFTDCVLHFLSN